MCKKGDGILLAVALTVIGIFAMGLFAMGGYIAPIFGWISYFCFIALLFITIIYSCIRADKPGIL